MPCECSLASCGRSLRCLLETVWKPWWPVVGLPTASFGPLGGLLGFLGGLLGALGAFGAFSGRNAS
eukprot:7287846-Pyramimonas_sp.AAC.1